MCLYIYVYVSLYIYLYIEAWHSLKTTLTLHAKSNQIVYIYKQYARKKGGRSLALEMKD